MEKQRSQDSQGGTGETRQGAQTTTRTRCPEASLGSMGGHRPEGHWDGRFCTYATNAWGHGSDKVDTDQVKQDMELCMRRGHEGRGKQIGAFLAGAGRSMKQPGHHTRTATYDRTTTTTPGASQRSHMGNHRLQRGGPIGEQNARNATKTTIRQTHRYRSRAANRPHTH